MLGRTPTLASPPQLICPALTTPARMVRPSWTKVAGPPESPLHVAGDGKAVSVGCLPDHRGVGFVLTEKVVDQKRGSLSAWGYFPNEYCCCEISTLAREKWEVSGEQLGHRGSTLADKRAL